METTKLLAPRHILLNGMVIKFSTQPTDDDVREAEVFFRNDKFHSWADGYKIIFNGGLVHSSKTYIPMVKKLSELISKWNLTKVGELAQCESEL